MTRARAGRLRDLFSVRRSRDQDRFAGKPLLTLHEATFEERWFADGLLDKKYFLKKIFNFMTKINRHQRAMIKVQA